MAVEVEQTKEGVVLKVSAGKIRLTYAEFFGIASMAASHAQRVLEACKK